MHKIEEFKTKMKDKINNIIEKKGRLYFDVPDKYIRDVAAYLFNDMGCRLSTATCMEVYRGIEVLYHFSDDSTGNYFCPRVVMTDRKNPTMNSISPVVKGAEWIEREMGEYWGVTFKDHPRPEPLLTRHHPKGEGLGQPFRIRRQV